MSIFCHDKKEMSKTSQVLLESILEWYNKNEEAVLKFIVIIKRKKGSSLRLIDWLVTNYSKRHILLINKGEFPRDLNRDYQKNLSAYNKKNMDPFARRNKIKITVTYKDGSTDTRKSTIGQLNFFRWFISNDIESILEQERSKVEAHMKHHERNRGKKIKTKIEPRAYIGNFRMDFSF